jgi:hypothetical protein
MQIRMQAVAILSPISATERYRILSMYKSHLSLHRISFITAQNLIYHCTKSHLSLHKSNLSLHKISFITAQNLIYHCTKSHLSLNKSHLSLHKISFITAQIGLSLHLIIPRMDGLQ